MPTLRSSTQRTRRMNLTLVSQKCNVVTAFSKSMERQQTKRDDVDVDIDDDEIDRVAKNKRRLFEQMQKLNVDAKDLSFYGRCILNRRVELKISQTSLSKMLGVSIDEIRAVELGFRSFKDEVALRAKMCLAKQNGVANSHV